MKSILSSYLESRAVILSSSEEKSRAYIAFVADLLACKQCLLNVEHPWPGSGNIDSKVMILGEAPSPNRKSFENFSEKSREVLDRMLRELGLDRSRVYITNAIKCQLRSVSKNQRENILDNCLIYLKREIEIVQPRVILALGDTGRKALLKVRPKVDAIFVHVELPHPMVVVYGSMSLKEYLDLVKKKCGLIKYLI